MTLTTTNVADVGVHNVAMTITLTDYPGVAPLTKNFVASITCEVLTLAFSTSPAASTTVQVGITTQPVSLAFETTQTPACGSTVTIAISPTQTFLSL